MIPLKDNIQSRRRPIVNVVVIALCSFVFVMQLMAGREGGQRIVERYGMIPARVQNPDETVMIRELGYRQTRLGRVPVEQERPAASPPFAPWLTLLTCIFLHGGWMHFLGNMWFLWIFGDNVEDRLGHAGYALFYVGSGVAASVAHLMMNPISTAPTIGASGAIAGVMGAYLLMFPHARVLAAVPIFYFLEIMLLPAPVFLGIWFVLQFFQGAFAITTETGGVAWWAHIGGFVVGAAVAFLMKATGRFKPVMARPIYPPTSRFVRYYRYPR